MLSEVRFGDTDGVRPYDGKMIVAVSYTIPKYMILINADEYEGKSFKLCNDCESDVQPITLFKQLRTFAVIGDFYDTQFIFTTY